MKIRILVVAFAMFMMTAVAMAQPRGGRGFPPPGGRRGGPPGRGDSSQLVDNLNLENQQRSDAHAAMMIYDQTIRQQTQQARTVLLQKMQTILTADQFSQFKDDLQQVPLIPSPQPQRGVATSDLVQRLESFDANHDGKITKDELPERMLNLLDEGDTNHDGALDKTEISNLAAKQSENNQPFGPGGGGGPGGRGGRGRRGGPPSPPPPPNDGDGQN